jgi:hypothetical protein
MMGKGRINVMLAGLGVLLLLAPVLYAVPGTINYQGLLKEDGVPVEGSRDVTFRIYDSSTGGSMLWEEEQSVTFTQGMFSVLLGSAEPIQASVFGGGRRWLSVSVDGGAEILPRGELASVGYAFSAETADTASRALKADEAESAQEAAEALDAYQLGGEPASQYSRVSHTHDSFYYRQSLLKTSDGTAPNVGSNFVHWDILAGVPAGFADGVDDTGAPGATDHGQLTGLLDNDHPQYALLDSLKISDTTPPNTGRNIVHWNNLNGVPSGFVDGTDDATTDASDIVTGTMSPERIEGTAVTTTDSRLLSVAQKNALTGGGTTTLHSHVETGDISSVTAGQGLSGGGTTGGVTVSHASDASSIPFAHHYPPFVAHADTSEFATTSTEPVVVRYLTIDAPDTGYVYVTFSLTQKLHLVREGIPPKWVPKRYFGRYGVSLDQSSSPDYSFVSSMLDSLVWLGVGDDYVPEHPLSGSTVLPVGRGTHDFYLLTELVFDVDGGAENLLENISLTAIYFQYDASSIESALLSGAGQGGR